jgi:hypothetical protein
MLFDTGVRNNVRLTQFRPVPLSVVRQIRNARPMNVTLDKLVMKNRRIRFDESRTEGKLSFHCCALGT